jgi:hypothetical protein
VSLLGQRIQLELAWQQTGLPSNAESVRITYIGTKSGGVGFAYNNFGVTVVPEPSTFQLSIAAATSLALIARRRRMVRRTLRQSQTSRNRLSCQCCRP